MQTTSTSHRALCFDAEILGPWVLSALGTPYFPGRYAAVGELKNGEPSVGVLYEGFTGTNVSCHIRGVEGWANRRVLSYIFDYPFNRLKVKRMTCAIRSDNQKSLDMVKKMGFELECKLDQAIPGGDVLIFRMFRENCKYLGGRYGLCK